MSRFVPNGTVLKRVEKKESYLPEVNVPLTDLPSRSLPYPKDATISYRPYSFGEVKKASQMEKATEEQRFEFILAGIETSFDKDLLTIPDLIYIAALRRLATLGTSKGQVVAECPLCGGTAKRTFDLTEISFRDLQAEDLPITATFSFGEMTFSPINIMMQRERFVATEDNDEISSYAVQCISHEYKDAYKLIENMMPKDQRMLTEVDKYLDHGINPLDAQCERCKKTVKIELASETTLIFPFRESGESYSSGIRFGAQAAH